MVASNLDNQITTDVKIVDPINNYTALAVRSSIIGTGILGLTLYIKNSRFFAKYNHINRIPKEYYKNEIKLKGIVRSILPNGLLKVEHKPNISFNNYFNRTSKKSLNLLILRLAGLDLSRDALTYLTTKLKILDRDINFQVVKQVENNSDAADAINFFFLSNLNVDLIRKGLARVCGPENNFHLDAIKKNSIYARFILQLLTSEKVADRRGIGLWKRNTWVESIQSLPVSFFEVIKAAAITKLFILFYTVLYDLLLLLLKVSKQGYYVSISTFSYLGNGYKKFAQTVERLTNYYTYQKSRLQKIKK